jgi:propanediol dehydratase small subunit
VEQELLTIPEYRIIMIYRLIVRHMCTLVEQELLTIPEHRIIMIYSLIVRHLATGILLKTVIFCALE